MWGKEQNESARGDGWELLHTIDSGTRRSYLRVYPYGPRFKTPYDAERHVVTAAQTGVRLAQTAIRAIMESRTEPAPTKKASKK